jgi:hypothetical protein
MAYATPKTNWVSGDIPVPSDLNRIEGNTEANHDAVIAEATARDAAILVETNARTAADVLGRCNGYFLAFGSSKTYADLYNALSSLIPNNGDAIKLTGSYSITGVNAIVSAAHRNSSTQIYVHYMLINGSEAGDVSAFTITASTITAFTNISIAW